MGALDTYATQPKVFDDQDLDLAEEVAAWVAVAIGNSEAVAGSSEDLTQLRIVMMSRAHIERAKGMLMERHKITDDEAVHPAHPRLAMNQHQAARCGRRVGPHRHPA